MFYSRLSLPIAVLTHCAVANGLTLSMEPSLSAPPQLEALQSDGGLAGLVLHAINELPAPVQIASAQFSLGISPTPGASGDVSISSATDPSNPLFGSPLAVVQALGPRTTYAASSFPVGPTLTSNAAGPLAEIDIEWTPDALGEFELVAAPISVPSPLASSHWIDQNGPFPFMFVPYANSVTNPNGDLVLARIVVRAVPEPSGPLSVAVACVLVVFFPWGARSVLKTPLASTIPGQKSPPSGGVNC